MAIKRERNIFGHRKLAATDLGPAGSDSLGFSNVVLGYLAVLQLFLIVNYEAGVDTPHKTLVFKAVVLGPVGEPFLPFFFRTCLRTGLAHYNSVGPCAQTMGE